jgi:hypothetical protein
VSSLGISRAVQAKKNRVSSGFLTSHLEYRMPYRKVVLRQKPGFFSWDQGVMGPKLSEYLKKSTGKEKPGF